ncbi:solute carrier family 46 member 2-like [Nelusetta ayraudi]|uniref:solute carrier family 46 member 2-like n=1 Tax=Nelusetta ayraudi TaxID=303726 RepID=UPI003F714C4B
MLANSAGIFLMAFVTKTYMFYIARSLTMFSPMPVPIVRSLLCQQVHGSSYGMVLTSMQLSLKFSSVMYAQVYTEILDRTLIWFPGFVYIVSSLLTVVAIIPIRIIASGPIRRGCCWRASEEEEDELSLLSWAPSDTDCIQQ